MAKRDHRKGALPFAFVAIPVPVLESPEYRALPDPARALMVDLLMQFTGKNNGRLTTSHVALKRYGWNSADKLFRAKQALLSTSFALVTRRGKPPSTAEWVGFTWHQLNYERSMDVDPARWPYMNFMTMQAGSIDPNAGREKRFDQSVSRIDSGSRPGVINPSHGSIDVPKQGLSIRFTD